MLLGCDSGETRFWCRIHLWFRYVGEFVRKVDDVTAYLAAQPSRLRAHHRNITTTRWRLCVTMETLWQQQYGGYVVLLLLQIYFASWEKDWTSAQNNTWSADVSHTFSLTHIIALELTPTELRFYCMIERLKQTVASFLISFELKSLIGWNWNIFCLS